MARIIRRFKSKSDPVGSESKAMSDDGKIWKWASDYSIISPAVCQDYGIPCDLPAQEAAFNPTRQ